MLFLASAFLCSFLRALNLVCFGDLNNALELVKHGKAENTNRKEVESLNIPRTHMRPNKELKSTSTTRQTRSNVN